MNLPSLFKRCPMAALCSVIVCFVMFGCASVPTTAVHRSDRGSISYALSGTGRPAVVFQSGLGDGKNPWSAVISKVAATHTAFAYD